jgi:DNA helicase-2/ATP-dependent DNA helicase PcrA
MRTGHHSDLLELELTSRRIPFVKFGGLKFLEAAHVKDFLAALRLIGNQHDEVAWFRLLRLHDGIGPARARALLPRLLDTDDAASPGDEPCDRDAWLNNIVAAAPAQARTQLGSTLRCLHVAREQTTVPAAVTACASIITALVGRHYTDPAPRIADLERLAATAQSTLDLPAFVAQATLDPPASTGDHAKAPHLDEDYVTLSTVHSAKGLEWPNVHLIHAVDGAFPSDMALSTPAGLAEEQRLFYVAATRARDELSIYTPCACRTIAAPATTNTATPHKAGSSPLKPWMRWTSSKPPDQNRSDAAPPETCQPSPCRRSTRCSTDPDSMT